MKYLMRMYRKDVVVVVYEMEESMMAIILILLGIGAEIVKANAWFVIPNFVSYILFGIGGVLLLINIISWFSATRKIKGFSKHTRRW